MARARSRSKGPRPMPSHAARMRMISSRVYGTTSEGFKFFGFATPAAGPSSIHLRTLQKLKTTGRSLALSARSRYSSCGTRGWCWYPQLRFHPYSGVRATGSVPRKRREPAGTSCGWPWPSACSSLKAFIASPIGFGCLAPGASNLAKRSPARPVTSADRTAVSLAIQFAIAPDGAGALCVRGTLSR